jgi:hypothetical protein
LHPWLVAGRYQPLADDGADLTMPRLRPCRSLQSLQRAKREDFANPLVFAFAKRRIEAVSSLST